MKKYLSNLWLIIPLFLLSGNVAFAHDMGFGGYALGLLVLLFWGPIIAFLTFLQSLIFKYGLKLGKFSKIFVVIFGINILVCFFIQSVVRVVIGFGADFLDLVIFATLLSFIGYSISIYLYSKKHLALVFLFSFLSSLMVFLAGILIYINQ